MAMPASASVTSQGRRALLPPGDSDTGVAKTGVVGSPLGVCGRDGGKRARKPSRSVRCWILFCLSSSLCCAVVGRGPVQQSNGAVRGTEEAYYNHKMSACRSCLTRSREVGKNELRGKRILKCRASGLKFFLSSSVRSQLQLVCQRTGCHEVCVGTRKIFLSRNEGHVFGPFFSRNSAQRGTQCFQTRLS